MPLISAIRAGKGPVGFSFDLGTLTPTLSFFLELGSSTRHLCAMTFGRLLPPVSLTTGRNVHGLLDLLEDLDTDSAGNLARRLLRGLERVREEQRAVLCIPLAQAYVDRLTQACTITAEQCPQSQHLATIVLMTTGLLWRVRVRIWFLRADVLLEDGAFLPRHQQDLTASLWRG